MLAVIVAAGFGSRLKDRTKEKPKGFLELKGKSLIQRSIENLVSCGIKEIYIGTGYLSEVYEKFAKNYPDKTVNITCIKSDKYASTSSMYTLYNMKKEINNDFLLLESDLLYEKNAINYLLDEQKSDAILASGKTNSNDEVYIQADKNNNLIAMSKDNTQLENIYGELVGISKISHNRYTEMCFEYEKHSNEKIDYEYIMVQTAKKNPFFVKKIQDLVWCEIDDESHLNRALESILPKINTN